MKFKLSNLEKHFTLDDDNYKKFKKYGFTFKKGYLKGNVIVKEKEIEINSIKDLMNIITYFGNSVIVDTDSITIYDSYSE